MKKTRTSLLLMLIVTAFFSAQFVSARAQDSTVRQSSAYWSQRKAVYVTSELPPRGWIKQNTKHLISTPIDSARKNRVARVLFIGNSYTFYHNLPLLVDRMAESQSDTLIYYAQAVPGYTFQLHYENPAVREILRKKWDFLVLQGNSRESSQPMWTFSQKTLPYAKKLDSLYHVYNPQGKTVLYMTWGHKFGDEVNCVVNPEVCTFEQMSRKVRERYLLMRDSLDCWVAPVGVAWRSFRMNHPTANLYSEDHFHPSYVGSYLAAATIYTTLFGKPLYSRFKGDLHESLAKSIHHQSALSVLDSLNRWQIRSAYHQPLTTTIGPIPDANENSKGFLLWLKPNPAKEFIQWNITPTPFRTRAYRVQIVNAQGIIVLDKIQYPSQGMRANLGLQFQLSIQTIPKGSYYFVVYFGQQRLSSPFLKL